MVGEDGTIAASELYAVAGACGQSVDQVRSCLRRLVGEGLFVRHGGSGRDANFELTPAGLPAMGAVSEAPRPAHGNAPRAGGGGARCRLLALPSPHANRLPLD